MVALALMVSCMPSAYTISASEAFGDGTEDIFTDGEITSEPAAEESTPDVSSADQEETEQAQQSTLTYENDSVKVTAEALEDGALPQNTALKADSVNENSSVSYDTVSQKLSAAATDKGSSLRGFFAYDVYFADGDGNRVEPNGRVRVTFEYKTPAAPELTDAASTSVTVEKLHYNNSTGDTDVNTLQANEDLKVLNVNEGKQIQTLQVETGNAAVFAVMWDSPETADAEAETVSGNEDEVSIASEELTDGMDISDEPEQDAAETPAAENPEVTPDAEPSEAPAENPDAEPTEAPAEDPDVVEEPAEDIASPEEVPAADENGETSLIEVLGDDTNLRVSPSIEAEVLATVNAGTQLTLLDTVTAEDGATWYKVSWEGTEAYIRSDMAQVVDSSDEAEEPEDVLESEEVSYSQEVGNVVVTATAAKGVIPEGAQFVVTPIEKGSDQYADIEKQLHEGAENESYTVAGFLAYDISFLNDDGTKIEPQNGSVRVSIAYKEAEIPEDVAETDTAQENMNVSLVHFVEDANGNVTEVVNMSNDGQAEVSTTDNGEIESANFETESFSTFSVVWLADNFTSVQTTSSYGVEETVDSAKRGITINMFNYNTDEINAGHSLQFSNGKDGGWEDYNRYRGPEDLSLGIMQKRLGADSYPMVDKGNKESSSYLFSTEAGTGKEVYPGANHLFKKDADGYYEYDSTKNFAQFNTETKNFTVYKVPGSSTDPIDLQQGSKHGSFFPFNTLGDHKYWDIPQISEKSPDFHFGMTMSAKFIQPKDGKINDNNMVFEFSGDDDVWVYIDGVLVLDIGGIHNAVSGSINFADGKVTFGNNNTDLKTLFKNANREGDFVSGKSIFKDYTAHTINFYYLERGKGDSNCKLKFNLPTVPKKSVTVEKQLSNTDKEKYANVEFKFQLLLQDDKGEYVPSNTAGTLSDDSKVEFNCEEINGVSYDNVFTLKPGQKAIFSGLEENKNYKVQELGVSKDRYDRVLINGEETTNENGNVISKEATVGSRPVVVVTNVLASVAELDLKKVNKDQKALSGAQFTLVNSKTKESQSAISADGTGRVNFTRLGLGTYTLTEDLAPDGYEASNESWIVKVTLSDDKKAVATLYKADGKTKIEKDTSDSLYHIMNYTQEEIIESSMDYSKTATVNDWDKRTYDINITASSKTTSSSVVTTGGVADVVMALDVSGSMKYTQTAGKTKTNYSEVGRYNKIRNSLKPNKIYYYYYQDYNVRPMINIDNTWMYYYSNSWRDIKDSDTTYIYEWPSRITALKEVVNQFIRNTATSSPQSNIGLAPFNTAVTNATNTLLNVDTNKNELIKNVGRLSVTGGTSPHTALNKALELLNNAKNPKYVILFTDGEPTGDDNEWDDDYQDYAEKAAKALKDKGIKVFTVGFALSEKGQKFLAGDKNNSTNYPGIASEGCAFNATNAEELAKIFEKIQHTVTEDTAIQNATVTDVIDPRFVILDKEGNAITADQLKDGKTVKVNDGTVYLDAKGNQCIKWEGQRIPNKKENEAGDACWSKSIKVKAKDGYIGGNNVPTNVSPDSKISTGYGDAILPQPKVNVKSDLVVNNNETTIFYGDTVPTEEAILKALFDKTKPQGYVTQLDGTKKLVTYTMGADGQQIKPEDFTLTWYEDEACTKVFKEDMAEVVPEPDSKQYYLKVTYNKLNNNLAKVTSADDCTKNTDGKISGNYDGNADGSGILTARNSQEDTTIEYGVYTIHIITGRIQIKKNVTEATKDSKDNRTFTFNVIGKDKTGKEILKQDISVVVKGRETSGTVTLNNLKRGTYTVTEQDSEGYYIKKFDILSETDCENSKTEDTKSATFILGNKKDLKNVDVIEKPKYTYTSGGVKGSVSYTNELVTNLDLKKVDSENSNTKLTGAKFNLEVLEVKEDDNNTSIWKPVSDAYNPFEVNDTVELNNLKAGLYKLTEVTAPNGYSLLSSSIYFKVELGKIELVDEEGNSLTSPSKMWILDKDNKVLTISNAKLYSLPNSGGPGTYGFTISGVAILATALLLFINNKRREEEAKRS